MIVPVSVHRDPLRVVDGARPRLPVVHVRPAHAPRQARRAHPVLEHGHVLVLGRLAQELQPVFPARPGEHLYLLLATCSFGVASSE